MDWSLPAELAAGASVRGEEYGWEIACFPAALATAERLELACLGGQFQFRFDDAVYEMYWLSADPTERLAGEGMDCLRSSPLAARSRKDSIALVVPQRIFPSLFVSCPPTCAIR